MSPRGKPLPSGCCAGQRAGTGSGLETEPLCLAFPPSQGCFLFKQKIINNSRLFLNRTLELTVGLRGTMRGRRQCLAGERAALVQELAGRGGEPSPRGFPPKIPVEGQSWGAHAAWMAPEAPEIQHLCKAVVVLWRGLLSPLPPTQRLQGCSGPGCSFGCCRQPKKHRPR